jgi:transcriptional regulator with PAS, ATPase and Fis domain
MGSISPNGFNVLRGLNLSQQTKNTYTNEFIVEMDIERWHAVEECKEKFLRDGEDPCNSPYMYLEIAESWVRSKKNGIDPYSKTLGYNLKPKELKALIRDKHVMMDIAASFIRKHLNLLCSAGYYMCLTDGNATLLLCAGEKSRVELFETINARPGAEWREDIIGTNCHSLCIALKKPVQLMGPYYYCQALYDNVGSGSPIMDENGDVIGVLLVIDVATMEKQVKQTHLLGWVTAAGLAIESQMKLLKRSYYIGVTKGALNATLEANGKGCIALDQDGYVTHINKEGVDLLDIQTGANGQHFSELFGKNVPIEKVLTDGESIKDYEVSVDGNVSEQSYTIDIEPICRGKDAAPDGALVRISLAGQINKVVTEARVNNDKKNSFASILGTSKALDDTIQKASRVAHHIGGVLLIGASGTGKELFAHAIHDEDRPKKSFMAINCASLPRNLIESELFGYEGGSFTGAERSGRMGKIELANGGTLFLDEIGDMPLEIQPVLLRVLEDKKVMRIGGKRYISVDFRVIAATNKNLLELVRKKQFRDDLYYRLAVFTLSIPSLKERNDDILMLARYFIERECKGTGVKKIPQLSPKVCKILLEYEWPGNVRQLENAIDYAMAMTTGDVINANHLPDEVLQKNSSYINCCIDSDDSCNVGVDVTDIAGADMTIIEMEKLAIEKALRDTANNVPSTALKLGLARSTLYRKLKEYGINPKFNHKEP